MNTTKAKHDPDVEIFAGSKKPHDHRGREIPDPVPLAPPLGYKRSPSLAEQVRAMVQSERLQQELRGSGAETFDEANDFDEPDEDPASPYEFDEDAELEAHFIREQLTNPPEPKAAPAASPQQKEPAAPAAAPDAGASK